MLHSVGMALLFSPLLWLWTRALVPPLSGAIKPFYQLAAEVALISLAVFAARALLLNRGMLTSFEHSESGSLPDLLDDLQTLPAAKLRENAEPQSAGPETPQPVPPRLIRRIDHDDPGPVLRLEALDHFVTVVTPLAHHHLRMRFADAVDEMDSVEGVVTHRSHWVALTAVTGAARHKGRLFLKVACGTDIPVSRKHMPAVEKQVLSVIGSPRHRDTGGAGSGQNGDGACRHETA
ncbi:MAG: LytTR family DNA-binding domain-containing protein [Rhodobacterales bacterium]